MKLPILSSWADYLKSIWGKRLSSPEEVEEFLKKRIGQSAGKLVMGYSQTRLGSRHLQWAEKRSYSDALIHAQILLHARICNDMRLLLRGLLNDVGLEGQKDIDDMLERIHHFFRDSAPERLQESLEKRLEWTFPSGSLEELAVNTGDYFYSILPLTENMTKGNKLIFQGQIRLNYINILVALAKSLGKL